MAACVYGDDFTGATDAVAQFRRWSMRALLLVGCPSPERLRELAREYDAIGVAGIARSLPTEQMEEEIRPALEAFAEAGPRVVQYKVCSTIDSSPRIGSFGEAIRVAEEVLGASPSWIAPAQPDSGRWTVFGNHFANADGRPYRLDRHPTMSCHPSTPMSEADVQRLLAQQGYADTGLVTLLDLHAGRARERVERLLEDGARGIVFDALTMDDLAAVGALILERAGEQRAFVLGSGGISYGIAAHLGTRERPAPDSLAELGEVPGMVVVSGSAAGPTARQIDAALEAGWRGLRIDVERPLGAQRAAARETVAAALAEGRSAVVYSARGAADVRGGFDPRQLGDFYAELLAETIPATGVRRVVVAGGDTSGYVVRGLGIEALEILGRAAPGGPVCRVAAAASSDLVGLELMLKGGQIGPPTLLEDVRTAAG